jgi:hypothetical protein
MHPLLPSYFLQSIALTLVAKFSYVCHHTPFHDLKVGGASVICALTILLLLTVGN